jgi:ABC-type polysaccharide/polyol phosphate export permease
MIWVGILVGSSLRSVEAVQGVMFTAIFPLTSSWPNTFAPTENMPTVLRTIAEWNPISALVQAVRVLWGNGPAAPPDAAWPLQHPIIATLILDDPHHRGDGAPVAAGLQAPHRRVSG